MRPFGYHINGGQQLGTSLHQTASSGFTAAQIFLGPPQKMDFKPPSMEEINLFLKVKEETKIKVYVHAPYVLHAFAKPENVEKNAKHLGLALDFSHLLSCDGYVLHMGGTKHYTDEGDQYFEILHALLDVIKPKPECPVLLENCANGNEMSGNLSAINTLILRMRHFHNVSLCFDTLHAWAWGYDYTDSNVMRDSIHNIIPTIKLIHLNSGPEKVPCGSKYDRHESISKGIIPTKCFVNILRMFPDIPIIVERDSYLDVVADSTFVKTVDSRPEIVDVVY